MAVGQERERTVAQGKAGEREKQLRGGRSSSRHTGEVEGAA